MQGRFRIRLQNQTEYLYFTLGKINRAKTFHKLSYIPIPKPNFKNNQDYLSPIMLIRNLSVKKRK